MTAALALREPARARTAPGPRGLELVRTLLALRDEPLAALEALRRRYGTVARVALGARSFYVVASASAARRVHCDNARNYSKDTWSYGLLRRVLGSALLTSEGAAWRQQRRLLNPVFHRSQLPVFAEVALARTDAMLARWQALGDGASLELGRELALLALEILAEAVLGADLGADAEATLEHLAFVLAFLRDRTQRLLDWPASWPLPRQRRFRAHLVALDAIAARIITQRRSDARGTGLVSTLLAARDSNGRPLEERELLAQVKTFLLAGHETTANLLTWTLGLLALHPEAAERVASEVHATLGTARPTADGVSRLPFTRAVIAESLRLYPPLWLVERRALGADTLDGHALEPGSLVAVSQYLLNRDAAVFPEPARFLPERFLAAARPAGYLPFGSGSRTCIGDALALVQAAVVVARLAQLRPRRLVLLAHGLPAPEAYVTLRPSAPVRVRFSAPSPSTAA